MNSLEQKVYQYKPPATVQSVLSGTKTVFLVGTAGAGKDTVMQKLLSNSNYHFIISHTTRAPRENHGVIEVDGEDYHFIDLAIAEKMIDNQEFVEVKYVHGNVYGTSLAGLELAHKNGSIAISDIEVQGVAEYRALSSEVMPIFLLPPDFETWIKRLKQRYIGNIDENELIKRLNTAKQELLEALEKPYFEYVINKDLDTTVRIVDEIAHGSKSSAKNEQAKTIAKSLLKDLEQYLAKN